MKRTILQTIIGLVTMTSLFLACGEAESLFNQILWSGSWLSICAISGRLLEKTFTKEDMEEKA